MRRGKWKLVLDGHLLVLDGHLIEEEPAQDAVHLANLDEDMGETVNRKDAEPEITAELTLKAEAWYAGIEERWQREFSPEKQGKVTH